VFSKNDGMKMKKILVLGNNGMLGKAVWELFREDSQMQVLTTSKSGKDATFRFDGLSDEIGPLIKQVEPDYIINCIGVIKPRINERDFDSVSQAIKINSLLPQAIAHAVENQQTRVVQIATDCVFSGTKGSYTESDFHDPQDVYGRSKSLGEVNSPNFMHLRTSIIGPENGRATSLFEWFMSQKENEKISGYGNHFWNGITTYHFSKIVLGVIRSEAFISGVSHVVPDNKVSKYELLTIFRKIYKREDILISEVFPDLLVDRTLETNHPERNRSFWSNGGYKSVPSVQEMILEMEEVSRQ